MLVVPQAPAQNKNNNFGACGTTASSILLLVVHRTLCQAYVVVQSRTRTALDWSKEAEM